MAFDPNQQDPNQQNQQNPLLAQTMPMTSSAPGAGPAAAPAGKGTAPQATPTQPFQNLSAYLSANAPQITQQANQIAGNLNDVYGQTKTGIDTGVKDFGNQVTAGYTAPNPDVVKNASENPSAFVSDPNNVKAFQSLYNDTYSGPANFESTGAYGDINANVNKAISQANLLNSPEGVQTYFQNNNPNATKGGNILDTVLLQGSPEAYTTVQNAAKPFSSLSDYLNQGVTASDQAAQTAQKTADQTAADVRNKFTGANGIIPTFQSGLDTRLASTLSDAQSRADRIKKYFQDLDSTKGLSSLNWNTGNKSGAGLTPEDILSNINNKDFESMGINPATDIEGYNTSARSLDPLVFNTRLGELNGSILAPFNSSDYLQQQSPEATITRSNVATPDEYSEAAALQTLTGNDLSSWLNPSNASQAGTFNPNVSQYNLKAAMDKLKSILPPGLFVNPGVVNSSDTGSVQNIPITPSQADIDAANTLQQSGRALTPDEQAFVNYFNTRDANLAGRGLGIY